MYYVVSFKKYLFFDMCCFSIRLVFHIFRLISFAFVKQRQVIIDHFLIIHLLSLFQKIFYVVGDHSFLLKHSYYKWEVIDQFVYHTIMFKY